MGYMVINTGDEKKCRVLNLMECPACGHVYELTDGHYAKSVTLSAEVDVCPSHGKELNIDEELCVQEAVQKALKSHRGRIQKDGKVLKEEDILKHPLKGLD